MNSQNAQNPSSWRNLLGSWLVSQAGPPPGEATAQSVIAALRQGWVPTELAFRVGLRLLAREPQFESALHTAATGSLDQVDQAVGERAVIEKLSHPLFTALLGHCLMTSPEIERLLTRLRRHLLRSVSNAPSSIDPVPRDLCLALAMQCFLNEYVFEETAEESAWVKNLEANVRKAVQDGLAVDDYALAILAAYRPLDRLDWAQPAFTANTAGLNQLKAIFIDQPKMETESATDILTLTAPGNVTSEHVQRQYEENPYPRWVTCARESPMAFSDFAMAMKRNYAVPSTPSHTNSKPEILIAGCGTGMQAIQCASQYTDAAITAIDLSRPSLAYALRKTHEHQLSNINYVQADLLHLADLPEFQGRFDFVECLGVLHHLADPSRGLQSLAKCLRPGGLIYLGVYSATARSSIIAGRKLIAQHGLAPTAVGIREFRKRVMQSIGHPGDQARKLRPLAHFIDFYSISMCRDLAFHVQEHQFRPKEILTLALGAGLTLLGFGIVDAKAARLYAARNPADRYVRDVAKITAFEREFPQTFAAMYPVILHKPA